MAVGFCILIAGKSGHLSLPWWGELLSLISEIRLSLAAEFEIGQGSIVIHCGGMETAIFQAGGLLLQPPNVTIPKVFRLGHDYLQWTPGGLHQLINELQTNPERCRQIGEQGRMTWNRWRNEQYSKLVRGFQVLQGRRTSAGWGETDWHSQARLFWRSPDPADWDRALRSLQAAGDFTAAGYFQAIRGLRQLMRGSDHQLNEYCRELDNGFETAEQSGLAERVVRLQRAIVKGLAGDWRGERDLLQQILKMPPNDGAVLQFPWLTIPELAGVKGDDLTALVWEHLGYTWERLNYLGLARLCLEQSLLIREQPRVRGRMGILKLKGGDRKGAAEALAVACGRGSLEAESWEAWLQLMLQEGQYQEAQRCQVLGQLLLRLAGRSVAGLEQLL